MKDFRNRIARAIEGYTPGEQPQSEDWVKLNTNENPYRVSPAAAQVLAMIASNPDILKKYPHPLGEPLRSAVATKYNLSADQVLIVNGSDEALALICRSFLDPGDNAAYAEISYSLYKVLIEAAAAIPLPVQMQSQDPLAVDLLSLEQSPAKIIFLPNPNAPTGDFIDTGLLSKTIAESNKLWVIDEAYNDFAEVENPSFISRVLDHDNVIVTRTFSKTHGLAGLRLGYAISSNPQIMEAFYAMKDSYNIDAIAVRTGLAAFTDEDYVKQQIKKVNSERMRLSNELEQLGFYVRPSQANFLLVKPSESSPTAEHIYTALKDKKILVRFFKKPVLEKYLRISIGTPEENNRLLTQLKQIIS